MSEQAGLRERKKRRTRQWISDVATGLFLEHGFDRVTVADIAEAAEVSVNTVFNYFPVKEDLFFDRQDEIISMLADVVRQREPGESAVAAVRRREIEWIDGGDYRMGVHEGAARFARVVHESPTLWQRQIRIGLLMQEELARALQEETGAGPEERTPSFVAAQLATTSRTLRCEVIRRLSEGESADDIRADIAAAARQAYGLLESGIGNYCV